MNTTTASELSGAQAKPSRLRKLLFVALVVVIVLAVCVPLLTWWYLLRTDYAAGFTKAQFNQVELGETLAAVLDRLKAPLNFAVISQRQDDSRFKPQYSDDVSTLSKWNNDESVLLILRYSKPRHPGGDYRAYEVWISKGKVQETRAYNYWE